MASSSHTPTVLNPAAPKSEQFVLTRNKVGRYIVEPAIQRRGSYFSVVAELFLADRYGDYPEDAKAGLRQEIIAARAALSRANGEA